LRNDARRLVRVHDLRAADAFQLAAARIAADGEPAALPFVTLDERLTLAASREGFPVTGAG
jgi:predicted nucleic acid-binding protein